ncbi:MAG: hypothetical protein JOY69_02470, partial [Candidatus Eremiobacteraeota bacterium]|nr:hypothetical protein [Candidatus Eremiobacteraeota bacterium]
MMDESEALEVAQRGVSVGLASGAAAVEATVSIARRFHVEAREDVVSKLERSTAKSLHLRAFVDGRKASLTTSDLSSEGLRAAVERTLARAEFVANDALAGLPEAFATDVPALGLADVQLERRSAQEKVEEALGLERLVRAADARVVNSSGSNYSDASGVTAIANSAGFAAAYASTRAGRSTAPVAADGDVKRTAHYGTAGRHYAQLESAQAVARTAARRAVELFGARKPSTMRVPVIFERDVAALVLHDLFSA